MMAGANGGPQGVICAGLFGSASTWTFNVATEILRRRKGCRLVSLYADSLDDAARKAVDLADCFVLKTHVPDRSVSDLGGVGKAVATVLATRDPRDAVASLMTRFRHDFATALGQVRASADRMARLVGLHAPLVLKYETGFTGKRGVAAIAGHLGVALPPSAMQRIARKLSAAAVARHVSDLLERGVVSGTNPAMEWEADTHWHPFHIGDGRIGKFRDVLSANEIRDVLAQTEAFCLAFGYCCSAPASDGKSN
jgi:hypothetical protein